MNRSTPFQTRLNIKLKTIQNQVRRVSLTLKMQLDVKNPFFIIFRNISLPLSKNIWLFPRTNLLNAKVELFLSICGKPSSKQPPSTNDYYIQCLELTEGILLHHLSLSSFQISHKSHKSAPIIPGSKFCVRRMWSENVSWNRRDTSANFSSSPIATSPNSTNSTLITVTLSRKSDRDPWANAWLNLPRRTSSKILIKNVHEKIEPEMIVLIFSIFTTHFYSGWTFPFHLNLNLFFPTDFLHDLADGSTEYKKRVGNFGP